MVNMKITLIPSFVLLPSLFSLAIAGSVSKHGSVCTVHASPVASDDSPAILSAFRQCGRHSTIVFENSTYHIESVMTTVGLQDVSIDMRGTLLWGTNISYWRHNSIPLGYQNQSTAWVLGGSNIKWNGHDYGTFDGNGQIWYDLAKGVTNVPGRPINLVIANTTNSVFSGIRFVQSQFWTMAITHSDNIILENIFINSTSSNEQESSTINTDGIDTFYSNQLTFKNWSVTCGDDNISLKANSSNVLISDSVFHRGNGIAIGSIGQYLDVFEFVANVTAEHVTFTETQYAAYLKTWTGVQLGYPPNGGGGGLGYATNLTFRDLTVINPTAYLASISQCTSYINEDGDCDTSRFQISNITWGPMRGTVEPGHIASFQCSGASPCPGIRLVGLDRLNSEGNRTITCSNVKDPVGFLCTDDNQ